MYYLNEKRQQAAFTTQHVYCACTLWVVTTWPQGSLSVALQKHPDLFFWLGYEFDKFEKKFFCSPQRLLPHWLHYISWKQPCVGTIYSFRVLCVVPRTWHDIQLKRVDSRRGGWWVKRGSPTVLATVKVDSCRKRARFCLQNKSSPRGGSLYLLNVVSLFFSECHIQKTKRLDRTRDYFHTFNKIQTEWLLTFSHPRKWAGFTVSIPVNGGYKNALNECDRLLKIIMKLLFF